MSERSFGENNFMGALETVASGFQDFVDDTNKATKRLVALEAENKALREALQEIADGKNNLGWAPCSYIAKKALQEQGE